MKIKNKDILCIGEVLWDRLPDKSVPGGAPMNVALHLLQFKYNVLVSSSIGNDKAGQDLLQFINDAGADTSLIQTNYELPTSEVPVWLDENNNPTFDILEPVAWDKLELTDKLIEAARNVGMIVYGSLASRNEITRNTITSLLEYDNMFCGVIIHVVWGKSVNTNKSGKDPGVPIGFHLIRSILEMSLFIHNFNMINPCTDTYETACQSQVFMLYPDPGKGFVPPECTGGCAGLPKSRNAQTMGLNSCRCTYLC